MSTIISKTPESTYFMDSICVAPGVGLIGGALTIVSNVIKVAWDALAWLMLAFRRVAIGWSTKLEEDASDGSGKPSGVSQLDKEVAEAAYRKWDGGKGMVNVESSDPSDTGSQDSGTRGEAKSVKFIPKEHKFSEGKMEYGPLSEEQLKIFNRMVLVDKMDQRCEDLGREMLFILFGIIRAIPVVNVVLPIVNASKCEVLKPKEREHKNMLLQAEQRLDVDIASGRGRLGLTLAGFKATYFGSSKERSDELVPEEDSIEPQGKRRRSDVQPPDLSSPNTSSLGGGGKPGGSTTSTDETDV